jgi:crotonobetainyl-CoA:carnitine CoA-transferase CaiB-like acyl-CoA transferase
MTAPAPRPDPGPAAPRGPLVGVRVVNLATMLGTGHATALLADFGADVITVELPGRGDALRQMGPFRDGESLRWAVVARNKRSLTLDLHAPEGQALARELVRHADVVVENFRPGTVARWGLGYEQLREVNPGIIMLSLSGYGQTGPARHRPGFGRVIEAVCGFMNSTGDPDGPPTQMGVPLVDYIAGTYGAMAVAMAIVERDRNPAGEGQWIDLSLYETMVRMEDAIMSGYDATGRIPTRSGNRYSNIAPSDVYRTRDGRYVFHSSATQTVYERLMRTIGREDLVADPRFSTNKERIRRVDEINDIVQAWFGEHDLDEVLRIMAEGDVPVGPVNTMADVVNDEQLVSRGSIVSLETSTGPLRMPGLVPKFSRTPGALSHAGPALGQDTDAVLAEVLGYDAARIAELHERGVV